MKRTQLFIRRPKKESILRRSTSVLAGKPGEPLSGLAMRKAQACPTHCRWRPLSEAAAGKPAIPSRITTSKQQPLYASSSTLWHSAQKLENEPADSTAAWREQISLGSWLKPRIWVQLDQQISGQLLRPAAACVVVERVEGREN